jgi:hypothetical protein
MMRIGTLPVDIQLLIYSFDDTIRKLFDAVVSSLQRIQWIENRLQKERKCMTYSDEFTIMKWNQWFACIHFNHREYKISIPCEYPWIQPRVYRNNKRLPYVVWKPICGIQALLRTYDAMADDGDDEISNA